MITGSRLEHMLDYEPDLGDWMWLNASNHNTRLNGKRAGHLRADGYRQIRIDGVLYYSSHLACLWMLGRWPLYEMDHKDRDPSNDAWTNLREATSSDNKCNTTLHRVNNTSGYRGVSWNKQQQKWVAYIDAFQLGAYDTIEEAVYIRDEYVAEFHGEFAVLNSMEQHL